MEIHPVVQTHGRSDALIVEFDDPRSDPSAVEAIGQHIEAGCGDHQPQRIHLFMGRHETGDNGKRAGTQKSHESPTQELERRHGEPS
jgi:hypothetical protein